MNTFSSGARITTITIFQRLILTSSKRNKDDHLPNLRAMRYIIITTIFFLFLLSSCGKMEDPVFNHIENFRVSKLGLTTSMMTFDVQCFNPNNTRARLKDADGEAWLDSSYVGHFYVDTIVSIPARSNFTIPVKLDVDMKYLLQYSLFGFKNEARRKVIIEPAVQE